MEEVIVESLMNGERETQIQAAKNIETLSSKERQKLGGRGVTKPLILMLYSQDYEATQSALFALLSLAFGSEQNKNRIVKSGAIPALINLLQCQIKDLVELTISAMLILSSCSSNKQQICSSGAIPILINLLNYIDMNVSNQAKLDTVSTLHNLSTCHQTIPSLLSSGLVFTILHLIQTSEKSSLLTQKSMALLEDIVSLSENALLEAAEMDGGIHILVDTMEDGSGQCREHAVRILLMICRSCREKYRGMILKEGVMPGLLQLSVDGSRRAKHMARELLILLRDGSGYRRRNTQSNHEVLEQIMQEIDAVGETVDDTTLRMVEEMIAKLNM